jgi:hypothetical protein
MPIRAQWHTHNCEECNRQFDSSRYDAVYCSATCRSKAHRRQFKRQKAIDRAKVAIDELIPYCGSKDVVGVMHELIKYMTNAADEGQLRIDLYRVAHEEVLQN